MKNFKSYEFQRTESNKYQKEKDVQSIIDSYSNNNAHCPSTPKDTFEARIAQLENRVTELEKAIAFFEELIKYKTNPSQINDDLSNDIIAKLSQLETKVSNLQSLYRNYDIDQIILDKFTPLKLSLNQSINEIRIVVNELSECNLKQESQFQSIKEKLLKINQQSDINSMNINEINSKLSGVFDGLGESQSEEEMFLRNIRSK